MWAVLLCLFPDARKVQLQLSAITSAPTLALPINPTDICELQSNIFTMLGAVSFQKHSDDKVWVLI
jgi:hypothetical protein